MEQVFTLIAQYGFPIVMCLLLFWYVANVEKRHEEELNKMKESVNNNTRVLERLLDKLDGKD